MPVPLTTVEKRKKMGSVWVADMTNDPLNIGNQFFSTISQNTSRLNAMLNSFFFHLSTTVMKCNIDENE